MASLFLSGLMVMTGLVLLVDRGGLIAWGLFASGAFLLVKSRVRPARLDPAFGVAIAAVMALAWAGTFYYVITTWETGEVVELAIDTDDGIHKARVWVLDAQADPVVYYDAPPEAAEALLAGRPLQFTRAGQVSTRIPDATDVEALPESEANRIFDAMISKYGDRVGAADIYYLMLGRSRDRIAVVARLDEG